MRRLPPKKPKLNPIHDVTGPVRWPQQEEKFRRRQQAKRQAPPVKFVEEYNSQEGLVEPVPPPKPDNA